MNFNPEGAIGDAMLNTVGAPAVSQEFSHYPAIPPPASAQVPVRLRVLPEHACGYLPDRRARTRAFYAREMSPEIYHKLMDAGFRRSGRIVYQPACRGCRDCIQIRIPVETFRPSKSQRRCRRRNQNLRITIGEPVPDDEAYELYVSYLREWFGRDSMNDIGRDSFEAFLYDSPVATIEVRYRDESGRLLAVGLCDVAGQSLSSMYFFHNPQDRRRGLGTFGVLTEIELARKMSIPHYYLGYWIRDCSRMSYKSHFRPYQLLGTDGVWRDMTDSV